MIKLASILTIVLIPFTGLLSQTLELEEQGLKKVLNQYSGKNATPHTQTILRELGQSWNNLMKDFGGYPELPYDESTESVEYLFIQDLDGISQQQIYHRIKEWIAINYGSLSSVLHYENMESGKIIVKGWFPLTIRAAELNFWGREKKNRDETIRSLRCEHTIVYTMKDSKLKIQYLDISYVTRTNAYTLGTTYVPADERETYIWELYPVTEAPKEQWKSRLSTLEETTTNLRKTNAALELFIEKVNVDKDF